MSGCSSTDALCLSGEMFLSMAIIVIAARVAGQVFRYFRQPAVLGEIIAGILLGPSALGQIPGNIPAILFPPEVRIFLNVCAQLGLIIFMFVVGLEVDIDGIVNTPYKGIAIGGMSVVLPFLVGAFVLSPYLYDRYKVCDTSIPTNSTLGSTCVPTTNETAFNLFVGVSMSVTAFPVLARIISDYKMVRLPVGTLVMACAALNDLIAWILLAICLAVKQSSNGYATVLKMIFACVGYFMGLTHVLNPFLRMIFIRQYRLHGSVGPTTLAFVLINLLVTSWFLHYLGFHAMLGAFMFGLAFPRTSNPGVFHYLLSKLETVSVLMLLPCFFLITGLSIDVSKLGRSGAFDLLYILIVAIFGKVLGSGIPAMLLRIPLQKCSTIAVLMNTRGLAEIVILNIGLQQKILNQDLFTIMVVMAVVTTVMAGPLLLVAYPTKLLEKDLLELEANELKRNDVENGDASILLTIIHNVAEAYDVVCAGLDTLALQENSTSEKKSIGDWSSSKLQDTTKPVQVVMLHFVERPGEIGTGLHETVAEVEQRQELERCLARLESEGKVSTGGMVMLRVKGENGVNVHPKTKIICKAVIPNLLAVDWPHDQQDQVVLKQVMLSTACPILLYTGKSSETFTPDPAPMPVNATGWSSRPSLETVSEVKEEGTGGSFVKRWFEAKYIRARTNIKSMYEAVVDEFDGISIACLLGRKPARDFNETQVTEVTKRTDAKNRMDHLRNNADQLLNPAALASADESMRNSNVTIMIKGLDAPNRGSNLNNSAVQVDDIFRALTANPLRNSRSIRLFAPILIAPAALSAEIVSPPPSSPLATDADNLVELHVGAV